MKLLNVAHNDATDPTIVNSKFVQIDVTDTRSELFFLKKKNGTIGRMPEVETSNVIHSDLKSARIEKSLCAENETTACWIENSTYVRDELTDSRIEPFTLVQNARERIKN